MYLVFICKTAVTVNTMRSTDDVFPYESLPWFIYSNRKIAGFSWSESNLLLLPLKPLYLQPLSSHTRCSLLLLLKTCSSVQQCSFSVKHHWDALTAVSPQTCYRCWSRGCCQAGRAYVSSRGGAKGTHMPSPVLDLACTQSVHRQYKVGIFISHDCMRPSC